MQDGSLFGRFFMSYLRTSTLFIILIGLYGCYIMRQFHLEQTAENLETRARLSAKQIAVQLDQRDPASVDAISKELGQLMNTRITVIRESGEVVGDTNEDPAKMENHADRPEIKQALAQGVGRATHYSRTLDEERMYVAVVIDPDASPRTLLRTSVTVPSINRTLTTLYFEFILGGLGIALLLAAVSFWISLRFSRSLATSVLDVNGNQ